MQTVTTIGLDIAKSVFQVHGVDAAGQVLRQKNDATDAEAMEYRSAFYDRKTLAVSGKGLPRP
jgi:hypothetical protein